MLVAYICCLLVGGALLAMSLATGHHGGVGHDAGGVDGPPGWLVTPLSLSFWTFFAAFFGFTGAALTWLALAPGWVIVGIAITSAPTASDVGGA